MKNLIRLLPLFVVSLFALVACNDEPQVDGAKPTISITLDAATAESLTFDIAITDAEQCAYMYVTGAASFDAETVLAEGTPIAKDAASFTIEGLQSATTYYIVAAASNANGYTLSQPVAAKTLAAGEQPDPNPDPDPDPNPEPNPEPPITDGVKVVRTLQGLWYDIINYYLTLETDKGEIICLDFYTNPGDSRGKFLPEARYTIASTMAYGTLGADTSGVKWGADDEYGTLFESGYCDVAIVDGQFRLNFEFTLDSGDEFRGSYVGQLPGTAVEQSSDLLKINKITSTSFTFTINAPEGQEWRCVAIEKVTYDMYGASPMKFLSNYGFPGVGPQTIVWENGAPHPNADFAAQGVKVEVGPGMDYKVLAALYDSATASFIGVVSECDVHTLEPEVSNETVDIEILSLDAHSVKYSCTPTAGVDFYRTCVLKTELVVEAEQVYYTAGFSSFEAFMIYLIESSAAGAYTLYEAATVDWGSLWYDYDYTICTLVVDKAGGKAVTFKDFHTLAE